MIGIAFSSWSSWVFGTVIGAFSGSGLLQGYPAVEAALGFMLSGTLIEFPARLFPAQTISFALPQR
ncbi:AzlC-like membrane protein [Escherichia coli]|uniref:AzlC-like membrane protein n=1 Tax=Escherichia coli TaxID=562 RepID=A0A376SC36_ECOLX|nr:AzlC-like membrane protein [Escherichia coli]